MPIYSACKEKRKCLYENLKADHKIHLSFNGRIVKEKSVKNCDIRMKRPTDMRNL